MAMASGLENESFQGLLHSSTHILYIVFVDAQAMLNVYVWNFIHFKQTSIQVCTLADM